MEFIFDVRNNGGGGGGDGVTNIGTGTGLTGGPITTTGVISLATVNAGDLLANLTNGTAAPLPHSMPDILDYIFSDVQGTILFRGSTAWTDLAPGTNGYFLQTHGSAADPSWAVGGGSGFSPENTIYFAVGGDDSASGTLNAPLATLTQAVTNANTLLTDGATAVSIQGLGVGIDTGNISITQSGIDIYAPGFKLNPVSGDALTVNLPGVGGGSYINVVLASSAVVSGANALNLIAISDGNASVTRFHYDGQVIGNVYLAQNCEFYSTIISGTLTALEARTLLTVLYGVGSFTQATRLNLMGLTYGSAGNTINGAGSFTNNWRYPMRKITALTSDYTLLFSDSGFVFVNSTTSDFTVTLPQVSNQGTPPFNVGYEVEFLNLSTGSISFVVQGSDVLIGTTEITVEGQRATVLEQAAGVWTVSSEAGSGSVTLVNSGTGLVGGPITSTGTLSLANIANNNILANIVGSSAAPLPHTVSDVLDSVFTATQGSILYRNGSTWTYLIPGPAGYVFTTGGASANPSWQPGGGGGGSDFPYEGTQWVAQNGVTSFNGLSINAPKLGLQAAITALPNGGVINIADDGVYTGNLVFPSGQNYLLNMPGATITAPSGTLLTISGGSTVIIHCNDMIHSTGTILDIDSSSNVYIYSPHVLGDIVNLGDAYIFVNGYEGNITNSKRLNFQFDLMAGSIYDTSPSDTQATCNVFGRLVGENIASAYNQIAGSVATVLGDVSGIWEGAFNKILYGLNRIVGSYPSQTDSTGMTVANQIYNMQNPGASISADYTVQAADSNGVLGIYNISGTIDITLPDVTTVPDLPQGWRCYAWQGYSGGGARFLAEGNDIIATRNGPFTRQGLITIILTGASLDPAVGRIWTLAGDLAGGATTALTGLPSIVVDSPAITYTGLASGGKVNIFEAPTATSQIKISNILLSGVGGTNFSGTLGDRDLIITDGTNVWTVISAATLQALSSLNAVWGSAAVPLPTTIPLNQISIAGNNIYAAYDTGSTDYTAGSIEISLDYERVTF